MTYIIENIMFSFFLLIDLFLNVKPTFPIWNKSYLCVVCHYLLMSFANILLRIVIFIFMGDIIL